MMPFSSSEHPRLALLIGAPIQQDDIGIHNDIAAMSKVVRARGLGQNEILTIERYFDRRTLLSFLGEVGQRITQWEEGEFFLFLSGHGFFTGETFAEARVGILLEEETTATEEKNVPWENAFSALSIPERVTFTMLLDH